MIAFLDDRRLLEEHHPGHDHRADVGRDQEEVLGVRRGNGQRARRHLGQARMGEHRHQKEDEFERPDRDRDPLDRGVAVHQRHRQHRHDDEGQRHRRGNAHEGADAGEAGEFGEERAEAGDDQRRDREPRPAEAEMLLDQRRMALAGDGAEADGQFLHDIEDGDQDDLQKQQAIAPLRAALRRGDDAARVGVGEHDHDARPGDGEKSPPVESGRSDGFDGHRRGTFARRKNPVRIGGRLGAL